MDGMAVKYDTITLNIPASVRFGSRFSDSANHDSDFSTTINKTDRYLCPKL